MGEAHNGQAPVRGHNYDLESPARRLCLSIAAANTLLATIPASAQRPVRRLRMLLNTGYSSLQAWLWLAQARAYLAAEGIELQLTPGGGAYTAAPRMTGGDYDLAYGDINSLIEVSARDPEAAPRGIYMMFNASPSCVLVAAEGPIRRARLVMSAHSLVFSSAYLPPADSRMRHQATPQSMKK